MDLAISPVNSKTLTVADLLRSLPAACDHTTASDVTRFIQKAFFELLWKRAQIKTETETNSMVTYQTIGHLAQRVLLGNRSYSAVYRELKDKPVLGLIKARNSEQDDMRFVLTLVNKHTTLLLENCAIDNKMSTVYVFNRKENMFVASPHGQLMNHLTHVGFSF